ncbi:Serine/arginine-rich splicing factor 7 like protein [Argiope bruennichi]|uniref:Serine/arginine-rich splicing factor 7 like protein n=1 Tax=Argiope bruennichi TaxID=94029 RepID=A0A8T0G394_ARGBR|nr:Serine/arginine-rich splicing factor 7 like protein [Argiope bruennichi]
MSSRYRDSGCPPDCKVYVGDLGNSGTKHEIEDAFSYYGPLRNVWVARNPPGFAFVEFEDSRDARDAVRGLDGKLLCGRRVRVELSTGRSRSSFRGPPPRPFHPDDRCYDCGERGHYARDCKRVSKRLKLLESRAVEVDLGLEVVLLVEAVLQAILQAGVAVSLEVALGAEASLCLEEEHDLAVSSLSS